MRFNRAIGDYAGKRYGVDGQKLIEEEWAAYEPTVLPTADDEAKLKEYFKNSDWIAPKGKLS
jgi:hypothetical protein